jgi:hypothetical protein
MEQNLAVADKDPIILTMTPVSMDVEGPNIILNNNRKRRIRGSPAKSGKGDNDTLFRITSGHATNTKPTTNRHLSESLCKMDVVAWREYVHPLHESRRKMKRKLLGEQFLRRRAFENTPQQGRLVHRKRDYLSGSAYTSCTFLNLYDKVLAVDCGGSVDIVKIGEIQQRTCPRSPNAEKTMPQTTEANFNVGTFLPIDGFSSLFLEPLAGGTTIAMGTKDELFLLDLERYSSFPQEFLTTLVSIPSAQHQRFSVRRLPTPKRLFYRDRCNPLLTLHQIARSYLELPRQVDPPDISELQSIHCSTNSGTYSSNAGRIPNQISFVPHSQPSNASRWSVCERYSGCSSVVQVAHVDSEFDVFYMQFLDQRSDCRPTIFVDITSKDFPGSMEEHITSISCVSDICVATSHISCPNFGLTKARDFFDRDLAYSGQGMATCVKLWDLRMMSSSDSVSVHAANVVSLPSFPLQDAHLLEPVECIPSYMTPQGRSTMSKTISGDSKQALGGGGGGSDYVITGLEAVGGDGASRSNNGSSNMGSIVATVQSRSRPTIVDHHKLDLGTRQVLRTVSQACQDLGSYPVYDIASSQEYMVCKMQHEKFLTIDIHDLTKGGNCHPSPRSSGNKKRLVDQATSYCIEPEILDRYGARSFLSCLAMNQNGTAILGGSADGDLFLWPST